ncbi:hypothetical protein P3H15_27130 [Rhodococcus sp. T2V]|uniref:hypothetical protein n=1 Tax=Rhodococcus sp. T2V TaxID=3034164 RepID=UPI0023E1B9B0|nr:hypothetical protein [Rhodococcus sp. T2V]MDF3308695.1 hypothetical protein [Rhodococcus sp. T2V]
MKKMILASAVIASVALSAAGCGDGDKASTPAPETVTVYRTVTVVATPSAAPTTTSRQPVAAPVTTTAPPVKTPKTTIGDGIFAVGSDVAAGTYSTQGPRSDMGMCAWTFLPYKGAGLDEAQGGSSTMGPGYMQLDEGQIVQTIGCTWTLEN